MNSKHIMHVGYMKTGTSWLWHNLINHPDVSQTKIKEDSALLKGETVTAYVDRYNQYGNITLNFCPINAYIDQYLIEQLSQQQQIIASITIRNPYEFIFSMLNSVPAFAKYSFKDYASVAVNQGLWYLDIASNIKRWQQFFGEEFGIFFYEDLKEDAKMYYEKYLEFAGLAHHTPDVSSFNKTSYYKPEMEISDKNVICQLERIIDNLERLLDKDLSNWRRA